MQHVSNGQPPYVPPSLGPSLRVSHHNCTSFPTQHTHAAPTKSAVDPTLAYLQPVCHRGEAALLRVVDGDACGPEAAALHADAAVAHPALVGVLLLIAVGAQPGVSGHLLTHVLMGWGLKFVTVATAAAAAAAGQAWQQWQIV